MERGLGRDDLIFQAPALDQPRIRKLRLVADPDSLGRTEPNPEGDTYRHGTMTAYTLGRCRCGYCRGAYANYRAMRRAQGKDNPGRPRSLDTDGHIPGPLVPRQHLAASDCRGRAGDPGPPA